MNYSWKMVWACKHWYWASTASILQSTAFFMQPNPVVAIATHYRTKQLLINLFSDGFCFMFSSYASFCSNIKTKYFVFSMSNFELVTAKKCSINLNLFWCTGAHVDSSSNSKDHLINDTPKTTKVNRLHSIRVKVRFHHSFAVLSSNIFLILIMSFTTYPMLFVVSLIKILDG